MNILILTHAIAPDKIGGSETQTLGLATELGKRNAVTVISKWKEGRSAKEKTSFFEIIRVGRKHKWPFPIFSFTRGALSEIRQSRHEYDVILAKSIYIGLIALWAKIFFKIPAAVLIEGEQEYRNKNPFNQLVLRMVSRNTRMIVQTREIHTQLRQKTGIDAEVIPNGVYLSKERASGRVVLYIGRLILDRKNDKGVRYLIDAVKDLDIVTYIVGDGPEKANLMARAQENKKIHFTGEVPPEKVPAFLKQGRVLVLPSLYGEGLPNVIIEAMCFGVPVIATKTAGIADIIEHGKTGFLVAPKNSEEIKGYILKLAEDPGLWETMRKNCQKEAKKYEWGKIALVFEDILKETAGLSPSQ